MEQGLFIKHDYEGIKAEVMKCCRMSTEHAISMNTNISVHYFFCPIGNLSGGNTPCLGTYFSHSFQSFLFASACFIFSSRVLDDIFFLCLCSS